MSVESEILRIQHNIANAYAAVSQKGGEVPLQPTSENLSEAINTIPGSGGGPSYEIYSTEEQRIGTWIDGKPLYRKVYTGTTGASGEVKNIGVILNLDNLINLFGILKTSSKNFVSLSFSQGGYYTTLGINADTNMVYVLSNSQTHLNSPVTVIAEYTKTTDEPVLSTET